MKRSNDNPNVTESEAWKICSDPRVSAFIFALASMIFSDSFSAFIKDGKWGTAIGFIIATWLGFFFFFAAVFAIFDQIETKIPLKAKRFAKWFAVLAAVVVFALVYYIGHYIM